MRWLDGITNLMGHEFEQAPGAGDGQGSLVCCSPWGRKDSDMTKWLNWTESNSTCYPFMDPGWWQETLGSEKKDFTTEDIPVSISIRRFWVAKTLLTKNNKVDRFTLFNIKAYNVTIVINGTVLAGGRSWLTDLQVKSKTITLNCRGPAWGTPPMAKVMRKEAWHMQSLIKPQETPYSRASNPKTRVYFMLSPTPLTLRGTLPHNRFSQRSKHAAPRQ